jgi:hypothetical protein
MAGPSPALPPEEWNFSTERVPDDELEACLVYEYMRESKVFRKLVQEFANDRDSRSFDQPQPEVVVRGRTFPSREDYLKEILAAVGHPWFIPPGDFEWLVMHACQKNGWVPWQLLPPNICKSLSRIFDGSKACTQASSCALEELWEYSRVQESLKRQELSAQKSKIDSNRTEVDRNEIPIDFILEFFCAPKPYLKRPDGKELVLLELDRVRFGKKKVMEAFSTWLDKQPMPPPKGKKIHPTLKKGEARGMLKALGVMRAFHVASFREFKTKIPDMHSEISAWQKGKQTGAEQEWNRLRRAALDYFRNFFPGWKDHMPSSWPTATELRRAKRI